MKNKSHITIWILIGIVESIFLYFHETPRKGLEYIFILPLVFSICVKLFGKKIIPYHEYGVGLKIYYSIVVIRFLIQPLLIVLTNGELNNRMPEGESNSYIIAILIYIFEIFIACSTIAYWYPRYINKYNWKTGINRQNKLNIAAWLVLLLYGLILVFRLDIWLPALNILAFKQTSTDILIVLEASFLNCLKVFLFIGVLKLAIKYKTQKTTFSIYLVLASILAIFNFISYFGTNRSFIYLSAIATIAIFIYTFPSYKKRLLSIFIPFAAVIMVFSFITKQFNTESIGEVKTIIDTKSVSNTIEEYSNGLWTVARSYQSSKNLSAQVSFEAFLKDISNGFGGLRSIPGINLIQQEMESLNSSSDIFKNSLRQPDDRGQMLSLSGGFIIYGGGTVLGWVFMVFGNILMIRLLAKMEALSKLTNELYSKYMYIWMACLMGLVHCYCLQTIIYSWSKFILLYSIVLLAIKYLSLKQTSKNIQYQNSLNIYKKTT